MDEVTYQAGCPNVLNLSKNIPDCPGGPAGRAGKGQQVRFFTSSADGVTTVRIEGELDAVTVLELRPFIDELVEKKHPRIVIDLSGLRLIDSSGVGALVFLYKKSKEYGGW